MEHHVVVINSANKIGEPEENLISSYLRTPGGRATLAASMAQPLRTRLDYHSISRKLFAVQQMPDPGIQVIYSPLSEDE